MRMRPNGATFSGRAGGLPLRIHEDRDARPVRCKVWLRALADNVRKRLAKPFPILNHVHPSVWHWALAVYPIRPLRDAILGFAKLSTKRFRIHLGLHLQLLGETLDGPVQRIERRHCDFHALPESRVVNLTTDEVPHDRPAVNDCGSGIRHSLAPNANPFSGRAGAVPTLESRGPMCPAGLF